MDNKALPEGYKVLIEIPELDYMPSLDFIAKCLENGTMTYEGSKED